MSNIIVKIKNRGGILARTLPANAIENLSWTDDRFGGYAQGSLNCVRSEITDFTILPGDMVEFFDGSTRMFRGFVRRKNTISRKSKNVTFQLAGIAQTLAKTPINQRFPGASDISETFSALVNATVSTSPPAWPGLVVSATTVGVPSDGSDAVGQELSSGIQQLISQAANLACWGSSVSSVGADEVFIRPIGDIASPSHVLSVPSSIISDLSSDESYEDIVNAIRVDSDSPPTYPNLIYNSGFERPLLSGSSGNSLVRNGGFEDDPSDASWDFTGGASTASAGGSIGPAFSGSKVAVIDSGDEVVQYDDTPALPVVAGNTYRFSFMARRQTAYVSPPTYSAIYTIGFTDASNTLLSGSFTSQLKDDEGDPLNTVQWTRFEWQGVAPATAEGIYIKFDGEDGLDGGAQDAVIIDSIDCFDISSIYQDGWEAIALGTGELISVDWASGGAHEGGYCVSIECTASDSDGNDVYLAQKGGAKYAVQPGQALTFTVKLKSEPGATSPKVRLYTEVWSAAGNSLGVFSEDVASGALTTVWSSHSLSIGTNSSSASALSWVAIRGNGKVFVDSMRASDANFEDEPGGIDEYIADGNFSSQLFRSDILFGVDGAGGDNSTIGDTYYGVYKSIETYGLRPVRMQVPGVTNSSAAQEFAIRYLKANAVLSPALDLTISEPTEVFKPGEVVLVSGRDGKELATTALHVARCSYSFSASAGLVLSLQLSREKRDEAYLISELIRKASQRGTSFKTFNTGTAAPAVAELTSPSASPFGAVPVPPP